MASLILSDYHTLLKKYLALTRACFALLFDFIAHVQNHTQDADVRFMEHVELADIGADLMGVEHPMYPRYDYGWCKPKDPSTRGFCQFPYDRNPKSKAFIPDGHGRCVSWLCL